MNKKLKEFFDTKGRRLAELKAKGGLEFMIIGRSDNFTEKEEWEFKALAIQLGAVLWAFEPEDEIERTKFNREVKEYFGSIEKPYFHEQKVKSNKKVFKGRA